MRLRYLVLLILAIALAVGLTWIVSPAKITPPATAIDPVIVHVIDQGFHARLVLPTENRELIEYAYGDWNYFALNHQGILDGLAALLIPTPGTLGRRTFGDITTLQQEVIQTASTRLSFAVPGSQVAQLRQSLDQRFRRNIETRVYNSVTGLRLVQDDQDYTLLHNSNIELVEWLKTLGCRVEGFVLWANFQLGILPSG